jgi:hypothetical protein
MINNFIFKSRIVYNLEISRLILFWFFFVAIVVILKLPTEYLYGYILIFVFSLLLSVRRFYFYEKYISIRFIYKNEIIQYSEIEKVTYQCLGGGRHLPVFIIYCKKGNFSYKVFEYP